jgi:FtsP/CotA-like multicopper oxidase with cupredoxin domain
LQAWNGVFGGIVINGPASANYDVDVGTITLSDWDHWTADMIYPIADEIGVVTGLTGLINGMNKWNTSISSDPTSPGATVPVLSNGTANGSDSLIGEYYSVKFEAGLSYRLRLVNTAIDSGFK